MEGENLPHCDELFMKFFDPWYSDEDRKAKIFEATRPDMTKGIERAGSSAAQQSRLDEEWRIKVLGQLVRMKDSALHGWPNYLDLPKDIGIDWVAAFDQYWQPDRIAQLIERSDPTENGNDYMVVCIQFSMILGEVLKQLDNSLEWAPEWPYWESYIWHSRSGSQIHVLSWAVKKMSSYGWDDGFAEKVQACVVILNQESQ